MKYLKYYGEKEHLPDLEFFYGILELIKDDIKVWNHKEERKEYKLRLDQSCGNSFNWSLLNQVRIVC